MRVFGKLLVLASLTLVVSTGGAENVLAQPVPAVPAAPPVNIYLFLLVDGQDVDLGGGFVNSARAIRETVERAFNNQPTYGSVKQVVIVGDDERFTDANIVKGLNSIPQLGANDVLFCWYFAHGNQRAAARVLGTQQQREELLGPVLAQQTTANQVLDIRGIDKLFLGHQFQTEDSSSNRFILRVNLWLALLGKHADFTLLFSDSCFQLAGQSAKIPPTPGALSVDYEQIRVLLNGYKGAINVSAASPGELSWYFDIGIFTRAFRRFAVARTTDDWDAFLGKVSNETSRIYKNEVQEAQPDQRPYVFVKALQVR